MAELRSDAQLAKILDKPAVAAALRQIAADPSRLQHYSHNSEVRGSSRLDWCMAACKLLKHTSATIAVDGIRAACSCHGVFVCKTVSALRVCFSSPYQVARGARLHLRRLPE